MNERLINEFWINFLANLAADAILAVAIYYIITQPGEKKKEKRTREQSLGLLKAEMQVNEKRARKYIEALENPSPDIALLFPLRYTRGAWNALKDSGFLSNLEDAVLSYYLFRMNETTLVANKNLRKVQLYYLENTDEDIKLLAEIAKRDSEQLCSLLTQLLSMLQKVKIPKVAENDIFLSEKIPSIDEEHD